MTEVHKTPPSVSSAQHGRPDAPTREELSGAMLTNKAGLGEVEASQLFFSRGNQEKFSVKDRRYKDVTHGGGEKGPGTRATTHSAKVALLIFGKVVQHQFSPTKRG